MQEQGWMTSKMEICKIQNIDIKNATQADEQTKLLVFGFISEIQRESALSSIPKEIIYLCILFLLQYDHFAEAGNGIVLSEDRMTMRKQGKDGWNNTTYCHRLISSTSNGIYKWKFKMTKISIICMGITSNMDCAGADFSVSDGYLYALSNGGATFDSKFPDGSDCVKNAAPAGYFSGAEVLWILDLKNQTISQQVSGLNEIPIIRWKNIKVDKDIKYKFAISVHCVGDTVTIIDSP